MPKPVTTAESTSNMPMENQVRDIQTGPVAVSAGQDIVSLSSGSLNLHSPTQTAGGGGSLENRTRYSSDEISLLQKITLGH